MPLCNVQQKRGIACYLALQERDAVIGKLRRSMSELSFKCEAATAQAEASHPYQQRYTDLQACTTIWLLWPPVPVSLHADVLPISLTGYTQIVLTYGMMKSISPMMVMQQAANLLIVTSAFRLLAAFVAA